MKNNIYIICLTAVLMVLGSVSCSPEGKVSVGERDDSATYGVYFPVQEMTGDIVLDEDDPCVLTFRVSRMRVEGEITVPYVIKSEDAGIFDVSEIVFAEDEASTEFTVSFPSAMVGRTYECTVLVNDPQYVSYYTSMANHVTFSVTRVRK